MHRFTGLVLAFLGSLIVLSTGCQTQSDGFPVPVNTQAAGEHPPSPEDMPGLFELPDGFHVTLFAGEPDVRQPIAFDFDDSGRVWVAENYSYSASGNADPTYRDRIIILEDRDADGEHDVRKVFWDQGQMLTGLTWGFGGLWILNDGTLSFIPDQNADDVPDREPVEMLNGWTKTARHNFVNGLVWGPDGWLYGRHGITDTSLPGTPDTPEAERQPMNCGIWRFHPVTHHFEIVCHGTTNPWGLDYDERGQLFMTNNVIAHLWHVIPGAHYDRMLGQDFNPHLYELMSACSDHYHWDNTGKWSESRDGKANDLGGGHSHCGGMIYQGDNFPAKYRGMMFMCNTHGRCVNVDRLEPQDSSYVAKHEPNFLTVKTPWFRGVDLKYGPAGCVYLSDWSDNGECHDTDGVHRTSGRIYRIAWGDRAQPSAADTVSDFPEMSDQDLLEAALSDQNEWTRRRAFRVVLERIAAGQSDPIELLTHAPYREALTNGQQEIRSVHAAWLMLAISSLAPGSLEGMNVRRCLESPHDHVRGIAIRLVVENPTVHAELGGDLADLSRNELSPHVRMCLASALQKLPFDSPTSLGAEVAYGLTVQSAGSGAAPDDPQLRRMIWFGIEANYLQFPRYSAMTHRLLRHNYVRRWASDWDQNHAELSVEITRRSQFSAASSANEQQAWRRGTAEFLNAVLEGLRGRFRVAAPADWEQTAAGLRSVGDSEVNHIVAELSAIFGDGAALADLRAVVADRNGDHSIRSKAVAALAAARDTDAVPVLLKALSDRAIYVDVTQALASFNDRRIPTELLRHWNNLRHGSREHAIDTLVSRRSYAREFVRAISDGRVDPTDISAGQVRQLLALNEPRVVEVLESRWGLLNDSSDDQAAAIAKWKKLLAGEMLANADLIAGAAVFRKTCAGCHRLYGEGSVIGPDLTGANRGNLDYLLEHTVNPNSVVPQQFTVSVIALNSGRTVTGVVVAETTNTITVQTEREKLVIELADVDERVRTRNSLMPNGLLSSLTEQQVRDLIAFVMQRR
ncbi:MAG: PVC-type heme-binding CxxCH protein [Planctomycetaceae bacterium]